MGHGCSKSKKKLNPKQRDNIQLNFIFKQIYFTAQLYRDRRKGQQSMREKELLNMLREPAHMRVRDNEYQKAAAIVNDMKWIKAFEYVMSYADLLKDNETVIQLSKGNIASINELIPYVESVIWGCQKGSIECVKAFQDYICLSFGPETYNELCTFTRVTPELRECFVNVLPTEKEVKLYLIDFCNRNGIALESMTEVGHNLSLSTPAFPDPNTQFQGPPFIIQTQSLLYPNYPGNIPQGGNFPQHGSSQGGFAQGDDGRQHDGFPQGGYPQGGFPQDSNQQGGFSQKGQSLGGSYAQRGVSYPQFSDYPPNNLNMNPVEPYKQAQLGGTPGPTGNSDLHMGATGKEVTFGQQRQSEQPASGSGRYPNFQKFEGNVPRGQFGSGDPLDELDIMLRNMRKGL